MHPVAFLARYWPFANGSGRIIDRWGRNIALGEGVRTARTSAGFALKVLAEDHIGRHILLSGRFDHSIVKTLLAHARPGDHLVDIGANIGYVSACFLAACRGSSATAIEPQPEIFELLQDNLARFPGRARYHRLALSDRAGELRFKLDNANRGASRIASDGDCTVAARPAGAFLRALERADLIKIDVEGHELPVIASMAGELERLRPRAILFEHHGSEAAPDGAIGKLLTRAGYRIFGIAKGLFATRLVPIASARDCRMNDYLALRRP